MRDVITRKYIQRVTRNESRTNIRKNSGGGGGGGGVSQYWVDENYVSKEFFNRIFEIHDENGDPILPNDVETEIDNIQAMFGFWTNAYLSALGNNPGGGGGLDPTAMWAELATSSTQQINKTHLTTALADYLPLTGGTMANTSVVTNMNADLLDGRHATDFAYGTNGIADSASTLTNKTVTSSTLDSLAGSFTFEGNNLTTSGIDEVGIQIGSSVDKFQLVCRDYALMIRQNDSGGTNATDWTKWITLPTKLHTSHQLTKRDQWFRFANLTVYGASYLVSIRDNFYNNAPTPVTWIINVGYNSVTVTQVGRVVLSPTSLTKLRIVRYSNNSDYGFHLEVYTPYQSYISRNTPEINIMNLGRDNMSDGVELVHAINDDTKWLEVSKTIQSGELLLEEVGISDATTLWGQPFDGSSSVSGSLIGVTSIEMNSDGALSGFGGFIDFHYSGSSADYTSRIIEDASGRVSINSVLYAQYGGNVGIGTTPSSSHKLYVSGTFHTSGNSSIGGTLGVSGATTLSSTLGVSGATTLSSTLGVSGATTLSSTLGVSGATTLSSTLSVSGTSTLTGHVGIGTSPHSTYVLRADGEVYVSTGLYSHGYVTALSDIRHKDIQGDVGLTVSEVANAPAVKFLWKDRRQEGLQVGSIAQYWQKVLPEAIVEAADGELTMSYGVIALLASIANAREIVNLKREIAELKRKLQKHGILE